MDESRGSKEAHKDSTNPCERCGRPEAPVRLGDHLLCQECYHLFGSCCMEFGADDLWAD